jgi:RNA polymerase sigma factor (sigma-70 family)
VRMLIVNSMTKRRSSPQLSLEKNQHLWSCGIGIQGNFYELQLELRGNQEDAEDALQEAFLKAFVHLRTFDGRSQFSTWFMRIAINSALMMLRKKWSHPEVSIDSWTGQESWRLAAFADHRMNTEDRYAAEERAYHLKLAVRCLPPALRQVIELQQLHDCTTKEVAKLAGISHPATKSRVLRARQALRRSLPLKRIAPGEHA